MHGNSKHACVEIRCNSCGGGDRGGGLDGTFLVVTCTPGALPKACYFASTVAVKHVYQTRECKLMWQLVLFLLNESVPLPVTNAVSAGLDGTNYGSIRAVCHFTYGA